MQFDRNIGEWSNNPIPIRAPEPTKPLPQPDKKLAVVLPFIEKEIDQATALLLKSFDLSRQIQRNLFLVPFKGIKYDMVMAAAKQAFSSVGIIHDAEGKMSDWNKGERMRDASGPNTFFHQTAWFFYLNKKFPIFLWLEPDCTPITNDWLYRLETEYLAMNKPFMGAKMRMPDGKEYMNGVAIYPWNAIQFEPLLVQSTRWKQFPDIEAAFDVAGGRSVLDHAHITRKIQLELTKKDNVQIKPETVLVHGRINLSGVHEKGATFGTDAGGSKPQLSNEDNVTVNGEPTPTQNSLSTVPARVDSKEGHLVSKPIEVQCEARERAMEGLVQPSVTIDPTYSLGGTQISNGATSQPKDDGNGYGSLVKQIRKSVQSLVDLNVSPSRKVLIVKELRRAKLVPKHFR